MNKQQRQQFFDKALAHMRKQGVKSVEAGSGACRYRGEGGLKCAIGALLPPGVYSKKLEHSTIRALLETSDEISPRKRESLRAVFNVRRIEDTNFLEQLQMSLHDELGSHLNGLEVGARSLAHQFKLKYTPVAA